MPTDDLIPDWRVQLTVNIGNYSDLRFRADTVGDLAELLDAVPADLADKIASVKGHLGLLTTVAEGTGGSVTQVSSTDTAGGPPHCAHGARQFVKKATWAAFFCPLPKDRSGKCDPIFKNDDNKDQYAWPQ